MLFCAHGDRAVCETILDEKSGRVVAPYTDDLNHAWYVVGNATFHMKQYHRALKAFQRAYRYDEGDWMALWGIADCYDRSKRPRMAQRYYERALSFVPTNAALRYNLANACIDLRQYSQAISLLRRISTPDTELRRKVRKNLRMAEQFR